MNAIINLVKRLSSEAGHTISDEQARKCIASINDNLGIDGADDADGQDWYEAAQDYFRC